MAFYESYTIDQLNRALTASKWMLGIFGVIFAMVGICNQWITDRIGTLQKADKEKAAIRQHEADETISAARAEAASAKQLAADLEARQKPRVLPADFIQSLTATASQSPAKDDLQISCVVGDPEAWALAEQIKAAFVAGGFRFERIVPVITTPPVIGLSLTARDISPSPLHACVAAIITHFGLPLNAAPAQAGDKPWTITIGRKP